MSYYFKNISNFQNQDSIFFLCGVVFNANKPDEDKRVVLKKFLDKKGFSSIILEENFVIGQNSNKLGYKFIKIKNLNDVETLAGMIVDGIFIIHESHSTASEIALFASNDNIAKKVFVLVPDEENAQENHFSGFLSLGYKDLIRKPFKFYPVTEKHVINENNIKTYTYFHNNQIEEYLGKEIEKCILSTKKPFNLNLMRVSYHTNTINNISYYIFHNLIHISIDIQLLKYYMMAIFNISEFRIELRNTNTFIEGLEVCEKWFKKVLLNTIQSYEKIMIKDLECKFVLSNLINKRIDLGKAISFILYSFHALDWIKIEPSDDRGITISIRSETSKGFKAIYTKYADIMCEYKTLDLEEIVL